MKTSSITRILLGCLTVAASAFIAYCAPPGPPQSAAQTNGTKVELIERDRDALGYYQRTRSYSICANAGARVIDFPEDHSFAVLWTPTNFTSGRVIVLLHGTGGTAYDELKDELSSARKHGYMVIALQWLNRETGKYMEATNVYQLIDRALHHAAQACHADPNKVAIAGFSRGGAVSYEVAWRDASAHRHFKLVIFHSGGVPLNAVVAPGETSSPDNFFSKLNSGTLGTNAMKGETFFLYSGDRDEQWGTRMSEQMAHAKEVLPRAGATVIEWVRDPQGGHAGYRRKPEIQEKAIGYFLKLTGS